MEDLTGRQLGPYQVVAALGEGGMAAVYKAFQPSMERYIALKILPRYYANDPEFSGRFAQEARLIASLQHPHILPVHDFGQADGYTYLVMPFISGGTLVKLLQPEHALPLEEIRRLIGQVGDALAYAHARGIIHRDLKPSNILLDEGGNCLLSDFGLARMVESSAHFTRTGGILGTPTYMSPEQSLGQTLDHRSDIYSLGVVLYEMATGRPPYRAETPVALLLKHAHDPLPLPRNRNPTLPEPVQEVILKALAKEPAQRYGSAGEMVHALREAVGAHLEEAIRTDVTATASAATIVSGPPASSTLEEVPEPEEPALSPQGQASTPTPTPSRVRPGAAGLLRRRRVWLAGAAALLVVVLVAGASALLLGYGNGAGEEDGAPQGAASRVAGPQANEERPAGGPATTTAAEQSRAATGAELERLRAEVEEAYAGEDPMRAVDLISAAIGLAPDRPQLYCERGRVWRSVDTYDEAANDFQQCLEHARQQEQLRLAREAQAELALTEARRAASEADDLRAALPILDEEIGKPSAPSWLQCERGELAMRYAAYEVAIESFTACRRTVQDDFWQERSAVALAISRAELAFAAGEEVTALEHLQEWAALDPQAPEPHCQIGDITFYTLHQWEDSLAAYQRCRELAAEPGTEQWAITGIFSSEANAARDAEDWDRALGAYEELIRQDPEAPHLRCERSEIYLTVGDLGPARDDAQTCFDLSGNDPDVRSWAQDLLREIDTR